MTDLNQKNQNNMGNGGISSLVAAVTGAVVGAGVAVAGVVAFRDKKSRDTVKKVITHVKNQAVGYMEDMQSQAQVTKDEVEKKLVKSKEKIQKASNEAKNTLHHELKDAKKEVKKIWQK